MKSSNNRTEHGKKKTPFSKRKRMHLISAICFSISLVCSLISFLVDGGGIQFWFPGFVQIIFAINAALQFHLFFKAP